MRRGAAVVLALLGGPALAAECPVQHAVYGQPGTAWELQFKPVPEHSAANQTQAFSIAVPGSDRVLAGEVYQPNGYTQSYGSMEVNCAWDDTEDKPCTLWEGTVYVGGEAGIAVLDSDPEGLAPRQVLFPQFGEKLWYSALRTAEFSDNPPDDVFTFKACSQ